MQIIVLAWYLNIPRYTHIYIVYYMTNLIMYNFKYRLRCILMML